MESKLICLCLLSALALVVADPTQIEPETTTPIEGEIKGEDVPTLSPHSRQSCDPRHCQLPSCRCMDVVPPFASSKADIPQFVMLTFDDAVTVTNFPSYMDYLHGRLNKANGCPASATFFVSHDYTNYQLVHELYRQGHEIAVHSITHMTNTNYWKDLSLKKWIEEMGGMRKLISELAQIPIEDIRGARAPFLQTAGNRTYIALKQAGFEYDSSLPTQTFTNPAIFPYTLDYGLQHECEIEPCLKTSDHIASFWEIPMVTYFKERDIAGIKRMMPCAMVDACVPEPSTANETFDYLEENFNRHYYKNRAPFPIFMHQAWLHNPEREEGFLRFLDYLGTLDDVFLVNVNEVIQWMKNPQPLDQYVQKNCVQEPRPTSCMVTPTKALALQGKTCFYDKLVELWNGSRYMVICEKQTCPARYPWVEREVKESETRRKKLRPSFSRY